jgi:GTP cyclohydrolase I
VLVQQDLELNSNFRNESTFEEAPFAVQTLNVEATVRGKMLPADMLPKSGRLEAIIRELLAELGVDLHDQHFRQTPARVARLYRELTRGYRIQPEELTTTFVSNHQELIVVSDINFYSLCPHHLLIYRGKMHFGYVPDGKIVGLSKIPRLIQGMAARFIVQEDLVSEIADTFMEHVKPLGCVVKATGKHDCVAVRGVKCHEASMTTVALRGIFQQKSTLTEEFHQVLSAGART